MGRNSKKGGFFFLLVMLIIVFAFESGLRINAKAKDKTVTTLVIGDSIPYGMALGKRSYTGVEDADKVYWLTEGGVNITMLYPDFKINMGQVMPKAVVNTLTSANKFDLLKELKKKKIEDIVVILGANWPGEKSAGLIVDCLKKLAKKSGCRVYYVNTLPYVNKGVYKNRSTIMTAHNKLTKDGFANTDVNYIDAYEITRKISNYQNQTWDGIHYSKKVYNVIFKEILSSVEKKENEKNTVNKKSEQKAKKTNKKPKKSNEEINKNDDKTEKNNDKFEKAAEKQEEKIEEIKGR